MQVSLYKTVVELTGLCYIRPINLIRRKVFAGIYAAQVKREAGENPARSRHRVLRALSKIATGLTGKAEKAHWF